MIATKAMETMAHDGTGEKGKQERAGMRFLEENLTLLYLAEWKTRSQ